MSNQKRGLILLLLLVIPLCYAVDDSIYHAESAEFQVTEESGFEIIETGKGAYIDDIQVNLTFFPRTDRSQEVLQTTTVPQAEKVEDSYIYSWSRPDSDDIEYSISSKVRSTYDYVPITTKIKFPLWDTPEEYSYYVQSTDIIDSKDPEINELADQLAAGEDDLYSVVFNIAEWVSTNIEYKMVPETVSKCQAASWVLEKKYGVCDEMTNLFIALLRSLNIPAIYVSGLAYSNLAGVENVEAHGWAEVYFPGYGFVPFDTTFGQFGYIDATHLKLNQGLDSTESSTEYLWNSYNAEIRTKPLDFSVDILSQGAEIEKNVDLSLKFYDNEVGIGSHNLVEVTVENLLDSYVAQEVMISRTQGLDTIGFSKKHVMLAPKEKEKLFFTIKTDSNLDKNYVYTFTVGVYAGPASDEKMFMATPSSIMYSREDIDNALLQKLEEKEKTYSSSVDLICTADENVYVGEEVTVKCSLKNLGNTPLNNLEVCVDSCKNIDLGISEETELGFTKIFDEPGKQNLAVTVEDTIISKASNVMVTVVDKPNIKISKLTYPTTVTLDDNLTVVFDVEKDSFAVPENVNVYLMFGKHKPELFSQYIEQTKTFEFRLDPKQLSSGTNKFEIKILYYDKDKKLYEYKESFEIELTGVGFFKSIYLFFINLF